MTALLLLLSCERQPAPTNPGNVVIRRLSRAELDHAARDLFGTTLRPGSELPADDFALGLDSLGPAQTFSALHLEAWERGVDDVLDELFGEGTLPVTLTSIEAEGPDARPTSGAVREGNAWALWEEGEIAATFFVQTAGTWRFDALTEGRAALLVDGAPWAGAEASSWTLALDVGRHELAVAWVPDGDGDELIVDRLELTGPLDAPRPANPNPGRVLSCDPAVIGEPECAEQVVRGFVRRAWRRDPAPSEVADLLAVYGVARGAGGDWSEGIRAALKGALLSPWFLYRVELHPVEGASRLSGFELATRLSFALWASLPDDRLLDLAAAGSLDDPGVLRAEAERMLLDPRADGLVTELGGQWLGLRGVGEASPSRERFPAWDAALRDALEREMHADLAEVLLGDRPLTDLLLATDTTLEQRVATHYGLDPDDAWPATATLADRPGLLGRGGWLAATSLPDRTSPVKRGAWVLDHLLCAPPPPPPEGVPPLTADPDGAPTSLREQLEQHRSDPACAGCHVRMDAIGLAFEGFDATGAARTLDDRGQPVDTRGELDGRPFDGPPQLAVILAEDPAFLDCAITWTFTRAVGRPPDERDADVVDELRTALADGDLRYRALALALVDSRPFRYGSSP
ncbi:MAG: DUF1592 domain-containing protein [Alphaproteobacteria bacterium]|nr:DUF1592 domain-containing protein [Alphaproteobacteria bacterium]MCB9698047.1 DUF1592 domain-containing protein [Alphaproteobacteria bacterium]